MSLLTARLSFLKEESLRISLFLLSIALLFSFTSCSSDSSKAFILESGDEAVVYLAKGARLLEIRLDGDDLSFVAESGNTLRSVFDCDEVNYGTATSSDFILRDSFYSSLASVSGEEYPVEAASRHIKELDSSEFFKTLQPFSTGFDEEAFADVLKKAEEYYIYDFKALRKHTDGASLKDFFTLWLASALA